MDYLKLESEFKSFGESEKLEFLRLLHDALDYSMRDYLVKTALADAKKILGAKSINSVQLGISAILNNESETILSDIVKVAIESCATIHDEINWALWSAFRSKAKLWD